ncbi:hypothetical protein [Amycolatopsis sp. CA-230715]|uniref:hypothetical protein n=1 Tax=Amycolatopsis sp. CA-230715 TaxID=2745196 RepID=UPI001C02EE7A|nr:hypothetical protein [Amycolatopsis sp. CA-230715]QWF82295.1 hypothetical protein HUW46_05732 [Amycolatopsis sp. CA-230715]
MTAPQPSQCQRCGQQVLPDPRSPGVWVDQYNGRFCGGNPQSPHFATPQGPWAPMPPGSAPPQGGGKKPLIFGGIGLVLVLVVGIVLALVLTDGSSTDTKAQGSSSAAPPPPPASSSTAPPADPYAPVPCDPDSPGLNYCFPPKTTGPGFMDVVRKRQTTWKCYKNGEKDSAGNNVDEIEMCDASNNVDQPFSKDWSVGYNTDNFKPNGTMNQVVVVASTGARSWKNEQTDKGKTSELAVELMGITVEMLWPDNKELQQEAKDAFKALQPKCDAGEGGMDGNKAKLKLGYQLSCGSLTPVTVSGDKGPATTFTETMRIELPLGGPNGK